MSSVVPTSIKADRQSSILTITWSDGVSSPLPFTLLRNACPCAECRGGHENMHSEPVEEMFNIPIMAANSTRIRNITPVGNYAITIEWEDGHAYGIYNWRYLRLLWEGIQERG